MQITLAYALAAVVLVLPHQAPREDQSAWFPATAQEALARELAPRLEYIDIGIEKAELLNTARRSVREMGLRLDTIGADKLLSLAPRFPKIQLPMHGQKHLDGMARLAMCTYYLDTRYADLTGVDTDARIDAAIGPMTLALSTIYLRHFYLAEGGTDEEIKAYLAGEPLNAVADAVQRSPQLLEYTAGECRAVVSALLD